MTIDIGEGVFTVRLVVPPGTSSDTRRIAQATQGVVDALMYLADVLEGIEAAAGNSAGTFSADNEETPGADTAEEGE